MKPNGLILITTRPQLGGPVKYHEANEASQGYALRFGTTRTRDNRTTPQNISSIDTTDTAGAADLAIEIRQYLYQYSSGNSDQLESHDCEYDTCGRFDENALRVRLNYLGRLNKRLAKLTDTRGPYADPAEWFGRVCECAGITEIWIGDGHGSFYQEDEWHIRTVPELVSQLRGEMARWRAEHPKTQSAAA